MASFSGLKTTGAAIAIAMAALLVPTIGAAQAELTISESQRLAYGLIEAGQPAAALELIELLQADGRNETAVLLIAKSRAQRTLGLYDDAASSGRAAFDVATTDTQKFLAARVVAQALASSERRTLAQLWLRRAAQFAPNDHAYAIARQEFGYVRSRNPLSFNLDVSAQPTDNINDAPRDNTFEILGLIFTDPTAIPISGTKIQASGELIYRLPAKDRQTSQLSFEYSGRRVALSSNATTIDPDIDASDFATSRVTAGWSTRVLQIDSGNVLDGGVGFYGDWSGGQHIQNGARARVGYTWKLAQGQQFIRIGTVYDAATRLDNATRSFQSWGAQTSWSGTFDGIGSFQLAGSYTDVQSESFAVARNTLALSATYALPDPVLGSDLSLSILHSNVRYDEPLFIPEPRMDETTVVSFRAAINSVEVMGFSPVFELSRERVRSNVTIFDTEASNLSMSIQSQF